MKNPHYWLGTALLTTLSANTYASNGINMIGFGMESTSMAGADVALSRHTGALNTNPAGLTHINGKAVDIFGSLLRTFDLSHQDSFGNDKHADNKYTLLGGGGYAQSLQNLPCTAGIGMFVQGGAGGEFNNITTPFGGRDDMVSLFGIMKLSPGLGCQVNERLSLGASIAMTYSSIDKQRFFPNSSLAPVPGVMPDGFAGYELTGADTLKAGFKLGLQYKLTPELTFGAAYTSDTELPLKGGKLTANYRAFGLGNVTYRDTQVIGMALPQEVAMGFAWQANPQWLLSAELNWINWADAFNSVTITARQPDNAAAPAEYQIVSPAYWNNQLAIALGVAYRHSPDLTLYGGVNYGKNPIPTANTSPLLAGIIERHITGGFAKKLSQKWAFIGGFEYMLPKTVRYNSQLFGNAETRSDGLFMNFMVSRRW